MMIDTMVDSSRESVNGTAPGTVKNGPQQRSTSTSLFVDDCGAIILGMEETRPNWDKIGANMNNIRTKTLIQQADVVVVRFGDKYRQWNAAFDVGYAAALNKSVITLHPPHISHMLKEVNASASAVCEEPGQVVDTLAYVIRGDLPTPRDGDAYVPIADRLGKGNPNP